MVDNPKTGKSGDLPSDHAPSESILGQIDHDDITEHKRVQEAYRALVDHSIQGLVIVQDLKVVFANGAMAQICGYTVEEILSASAETLTNFIHPQDRALVWQQHKARLEGESPPDRYEFRVIRKDGHVRWLEILTSRVEYHGRPAIQAACIDVTERQEAEQALRHSEARNRALLEAMPDQMFTFSADAVFLDCQLSSPNVLAAELGHPVGRHVEEVFPQDIAANLTRCIEHTIRTGQSNTVEYSLPGADGRSHGFECRLVACGDRDVLAIVRNISERRRAERLGRLQRDVAARLSGLSDLKEGLQYCLEEAIRTSHVDCGGIYTIDKISGRLDLCVHLGLSEDFVDAIVSYPANSQFARLVAGGEPVYAVLGQLGMPFGPAQRRERLRAIGTIPIKHDGRVVACLNVASHTAEEVSPWSRTVLDTVATQIGSAMGRLKLLEALQRTEREKALILDTMSEIVTYQDTSHRIVWANRAALKALGITADQAVGRFCYELWDAGTEPCPNCPVHKALETGRSEELETEGYNDGIWLVRGEPIRDAGGQMIGVVEMALDISERERAEQNLRRRLKFEEAVKDISTDFVHLRAHEIGAGIERTLARIGLFADCDASHIAVLGAHGGQAGEFHAWYADGMEPFCARLEELDGRRFPLGDGSLCESGILDIADVENLTGDAADLKEMLEPLGIKSLLSVPIEVGGKLFGCLGLSAVRDKASWSQDTVSLLSITAEIVANALERKRSTEILNERLAFETFLSDLSATLVNLPSERIDAEIEAGLARIGEALGVDRSVVMQVGPAEDAVQFTHAWAAPGIRKPPTDLTGHGFRWILKRIREGQVVVISRAEDAPDEAAWEKEYCRREGLQSVVVIPLAVGGAALGAVSFASVSRNRVWSDALVQRFRLVGEIIANALVRKWTEESLRRSEEAFRGIFENAVLGVYRTTPDGRILMANPSLLRMLGYRDFAELASVNVEQAYQPGYPRAAFLDRIEAQDEVIGFESAWRRSDGTAMFVRENARAVRGEAGRTLYYEGTVEDVTEQKRASDLLNERLVFETLLSELSAAFVNLPSDRIDVAIEAGLARLGETLGIDRAILVEVARGENSVRSTHSWANPSVKKPPATLRGYGLFWFLERIHHGETVAFSTVEELPDEATHEREYCRQEGVQSLLLIPLAVGGDVVGALSFATVQHARRWSDEMVQRLHLVGEIFANALVRQRAEGALRESEERYRLVSENIPVAVYCALPDATSTTLFLSGQIETLTGWTSEEFTADPAAWADIVHPDDRERVWRSIEQHRFAKGLLDVEYRIVTRDGHVKWIRDRATPMLNSDGRILQINGFMEDITDRRAAEDALRESELRFREMAELLPQTVFEMDAEGRFTFANRTGLTAFGYAEEDIAHTNVLDVVVPADRERAMQNIQKKMAGEAVDAREYAALRQDGTTFPVLLYSSRILCDGRPVGLRGILVDITERKRMEDALLESERKYRELYEGSRDGTVMTDLSGRILHCNAVFRDMLGYGETEIGELTYQEITPLQWHAQEENIIADQVYPRGYSDVYEKEYIRKDGSVFPIEIRIYLDRDIAGQAVGLWAVVRDITERKQAELALRASERNYREIFNATNEAIYVHDADSGAILDVNETMLRTSGCSYEEALQLGIGDLSQGDPPYSREDAAAWVRKAAQEGPQLFEWLSRDRDGRVYWEEVNLKLAVIGGERRVLAVVRDISERKKAEEQVRQHLSELTRAWHASTLGEMASGLAHELNQPLCAILNYSNACLRLSHKENLPADTLRDSVGQIANQAQRAADIIKRIRGLIAKREVHRTELDLENILIEAVNMLRHEAARHDVAIVSRFASELPPTKGDSVEIQQVVLNLMRNAIEAMNVPEITTRTLTISTGLSDAHVEVAVRDTGRGIPPELSEKIFESFFTTKHEGLGIGLSLSHRIVETHGGRLWAESDGGSGATFKFTLPVEGVFHGEGESHSLRRR